ncbi:DUF2971 domain-containing protein [Rhizobium leguminosarum]|nr:DUF2971 domain-containing protein [Rhizobium leguminosarum]
MWAHYAQTHQGFVLEFSEDEIARTLPEFQIESVRYSDQPLDDFSDLIARVVHIAKPRYTYFLQRRFAASDRNGEMALSEALNLEDVCRSDVISTLNINVMLAPQHALIARGNGDEGHAQHGFRLFHVIARGSDRGARHLPFPSDEQGQRRRDGRGALSHPQQRRVA